MAKPERIRKIQVLAEMLPIPSREPTISTMKKDMRRTTIVRRAVATVESVFRMPHLARIEVTPAKRADKSAKSTHMIIPFFRHSRSRVGFPLLSSCSTGTYFSRKKTLVKPKKKILSRSRELAGERSRKDGNAVLRADRGHRALVLYICQ